MLRLLGPLSPPPRELRRELLPSELLEVQRRMDRSFCRSSDPPLALFTNVLEGVFSEVRVSSILRSPNAGLEHDAGLGGDVYHAWHLVGTSLGEEAWWFASCWC